MTNDNSILHDASPFSRYGSFFLIFVTVLGLHLVTTYHPIGAETMFRWIANRLLLERHQDIPLNEHTLRWSMNGPMLAVQTVFSSSPVSYYFAPLLWMSAACAFFWECGRRLCGWAGALIAVVPTLIDPLSFFAAATPLPSAFGMAYLGAGILLMIISLQQRDHLGWFLAACVLFFIAYGAKVTNIFFPMGIWIYLLISGRVRLFAYGAVLMFSLLALETLIVNWMSGSSLTFGRIEVLAHSSHLVNMMGRQYELSDIFARWYTGFDWPSRFILYGGLIAMMVIVASHRRYPSELSAIAFGGMVFALLTTFGIVSVSPLRFLQEPVPRYLLVFMPFAGLAIAGLLYAVSDGTGGPLRRIGGKFGLTFVVSLSGVMAVASPVMPLNIGTIEVYGDVTRSLRERGCGFVFFYNGVFQVNRGLFASADELSATPWTWGGPWLAPIRTFTPPDNVRQWLEKRPDVKMPWLVYLAPQNGAPQGYVYVDRSHRMFAIPEYEGDLRCRPETYWSE